VKNDDLETGTKPMLRIYADFNDTIGEDRIRLRHPDDVKSDMRTSLREGMRVVLWDGDIELEGTLELRDGLWYARVSWADAIDKETGEHYQWRT